MIPLAPILSALAANGLSILSGAIQAKGKEVIEEKLGIKIPNNPEELTPELIVQLKERSMEHEEFLITSQIKKAEIELEAGKVASQEVTKRWEADMLSDSYLSKNVRPLALLGTLSFIAITAILSAFSISIGDAYVILFKDLLQVMVGAYFVGRTVEKGIDVYQGWKQTKGD